MNLDCAGNEKSTQIFGGNYLELIPASTLKQHWNHFGWRSQYLRMLSRDGPWISTEEVSGGLCSTYSFSTVTEYLLLPARSVCVHILDCMDLLTLPLMFASFFYTNIVPLVYSPSAVYALYILWTSLWQKIPLGGNKQSMPFHVLTGKYDWVHALFFRPSVRASTS